MPADVNLSDLTACNDNPPPASTPSTGNFATSQPLLTGAAQASVTELQISPDQPGVSIVLPQTCPLTPFPLTPQPNPGMSGCCQALMPPSMRSIWPWTCQASSLQR